MKRVIYIVIVLLALLGSFAAGSTWARYVQARFDLSVAISTEAKLRKSLYESVRDDNAVRLFAAYHTLDTTPSFVSWFGPGTRKLNPPSQAKNAQIIHDVLLERFKKDIPSEVIEAVLQQHLSKTETISISVQE
jgi:hypothetical protein